MLPVVEKIFTVVKDDDDWKTAFICPGVQNNLKPSSLVIRLNSLQYQIIKRCIFAYVTTPLYITHLLANIPLLTDFLHTKVIRFNMIKNTNIQDRQFLNELIANVTEHHINTKFKYLLTNSNVTFKSFFDTNIPKFVTPNRYTTPFFSGHGPFAYYLQNQHKHTPMLPMWRRRNSITHNHLFSKHKHYIQIFPTQHTNNRIHKNKTTI